MMRAIAALLIVAGCGRPARTTPPEPRVVASIDYEVTAAGAVLEVVATVRGGADAVVADAPAGVVSVEVEDGRGRRGAESAAEPNRWVTACDGTCRISYRYDLDAAARASGDSLDVAVRSGGDVLAPASTWLLRPEPLTPNVPVTLAVRTLGGTMFRSAFGPGPAPHDSETEASGPTAIALTSQELLTAGYTAFGAPRELVVGATRGSVDVSILRGELAADDALLGRWIRETAASLDHVFGRFPVPRARLFVVPVAGSSEVVLGRTLPSGGASVAVLVGASATERELFDDWILAHELFHLGVPSFWKEGRWLDEGLATYYEPLVRARAGLIGEREVWTDLAGGLERAAVVDDTAPPLARSLDHGRVYWGGALVALRADLEIRRRTRGERSLDDALRAVLARGGDATRIWSVEHFVREADEATGTTVLSALYALARERSVDRGCSVIALPGCAGETAKDVGALMRALGVSVGRADVELYDEAPLASLRVALARRPGTFGDGLGASER